MKLSTQATDTWSANCFSQHECLSMQTGTAGWQMRLAHSSLQQIDLRNNNNADLKLVLQSPDLAKVNEELSRLQKRLKAGTKLVEDKQKLQREQSQLSAKLQADLENVTDGKACCCAQTWSQ